MGICVADGQHGTGTFVTVEYTAAQREAWNDFVAAAPTGDLLQSWEWGELKARGAWQPLRLALHEEGRIVAAAALLKRRLPLPGASILYAPRGPVLDFSRPELIHHLALALRQIGRREGALLVKIDPPVEQPEVAECLLAAGFVRAGQGSGEGQGFGGEQPRCVMKLDLAPSLDELLKQCKEKTRYNIRLAGRKGVTVRVGETLEDMRTFYDLLQITAERDGFLIRAFDYYRDTWEILVGRGRARLFLAEYQGQALAGAITYLFGDKAWYTYGASSNEHRNVMPNYLMQWEMIRWAKECGCTLYDFRGVSQSNAPDANDHLSGLNRFKAGFNARFVEYIGEFDLPLSSAGYWVWRYGKPRAQAALKRFARLTRGRRAR
ncbi:MAG: peptidoglycan bridge formation glycyltransferase FemA/FemB family protein [Armatimonadetes bacterium]|nr:peptidoglycan bridge formation glycyltransferase FemA/FemB family protein [Armatimonadota bacterium]